MKLNNKANRLLSDLIRNYDEMQQVNDDIKLNNRWLDDCDKRIADAISEQRELFSEQKELNETKRKLQNEQLQIIKKLVDAISS